MDLEITTAEKQMEEKEALVPVLAHHLFRLTLAAMWTEILSQVGNIQDFHKQAFQTCLGVLEDITAR